MQVRVRPWLAVFGWILLQAWLSQESNETYQRHRWIGKNKSCYSLFPDFLMIFTFITTFYTNYIIWLHVVRETNMSLLEIRNNGILITLFIFIGWVTKYHKYYDDTMILPFVYVTLLSNCYSLILLLNITFYLLS